MQPSQKSAALAASKWRKDTMVWCDMCKCYMKNHLSAIKNHEQGEAHKLKVEEHMKAVKERGRQAQRDNDMAKSMMGDIEKRARQAYESDISGLQRPEDIFGPSPPPQGAKPPSSAALQRAEIEGGRKELLQAVDTELKREQEEAYRLRVVSQPPQWAYDERTGYYSDATSGFMYDPKTEQYFNPATRAWSTQGPTVEGEDDEPEEYLLNPYSSAAPPPAAAAQGPAPPLPKVMPVVSTTRPTSAPHPLALGAKQAPVAKTAAAVAAAAGGGAAAGAGAGAGAGSAMQKATTAYMLGFGTNHPKFEAARAKTVAAQQRVLGATGGAKIEVSGGPRGLGKAADPAAGAKRKMSEAAAAKASAKSKEEAEALARREAARKRVESRSLGMFGLK